MQRDRVTDRDESSVRIRVGGINVALGIGTRNVNEMTSVCILSHGPVDLTVRLMQIARFPDYVEEANAGQSDKGTISFPMHLCLYPGTAIRKLLRTVRRAYVGGTKAMHRFTSRTVRFDSPRGKELYGRPGTPAGSTAPICRNCTLGNRRVFGDGRIIIR